MSAASLLREWPAGSSLVVSRLDGARVDDLAVEGDVMREVEWASVTKVAVAVAAARTVSDGAARFEQPAGPEGATIAHLLAHASGLGLEATDPKMAVGARRIYSNAGIDLAAAELSGDDDAPSWLSRCSAELGLTTSFSGRAAAGARGPLRDVVTLASALASSPLIDAGTRDRCLAPFLPDLVGVVPGFGRFSPCWWGLGVELHGDKDHWMGLAASPRSFGHFGQSGVLVLVDPDAGLIVAAASSERFGPWARSTWPRWMDEVIRWGTPR